MQNRINDRQNYQRIPLIKAVRNQRRALFFVRSSSKKMSLFFWYFSFGQAKEKYARDGQITTGTEWGKMGNFVQFYKY
jgi:hypothetical protein